MNLYEIDGVTKQIGESKIGATAKVWRKGDRIKVFFGIGARFKSGYSGGTITWDVTANKWYGNAYQIAHIKKEFGL